MFAHLRSPFPLSSDWAALLLRIAFGGFMAINHGWPKWLSYSEKAANWADPLGVGGPASLALAIFGELICGILIVLGLFTRLAVIPAGITMAVVVLLVQWSEPFAKKEYALLFLFAYAAIYWLGSGRYSLDAVLAGRDKTGSGGNQAADHLDHA